MNYQQAIKPAIQSITKRFRIKEYRVLFENFASLSILQLSNYLLPIITLPYLVRILGVEKYGTIAFAQSFVQYFVIITDYGFNLSATKEIAVNKDDLEKVSGIFSSVMIIKLALTLVSFIAFIIMVGSIEKFSENEMLFLLSFGIVIGNVLFPVWFFQGMEKMKYITALNVISKLIFTFLIFGVIRESSDFLFVPLLYSIGYVISGIIGIYIVIKQFKVKVVIPSLRQVKYHLYESSQYFLSRVSVSIYTSSNVFILGLFTNNTVVGYYTAAEKIFMIAKSVVSPLADTIYPHMANSSNKQFFKKIFKLSVVLNTTFCLVLFFFSNLIIKTIYGVNFLDSVILLKVFSIAQLFVVPSVLLGYPFLAALGFPKFTNMSVIVGSILHILFLIILSQLFINGLTIAVIVLFSEAFVLLYRLYGVKKYNLTSLIY